MKRIDCPLPISENSNVQSNVLAPDFSTVSLVPMSALLEAVVDGCVSNTIVAQGRAGTPSLVI